MSRQKHPHMLCSLVAFIPLLAAWMVFAPIQFGGQAAYVIVNGNSMEPLYRRGDLVILRESSSYQVGDIATYRHPQIGPVIHRIIQLHGNRYIFRGDHNGWDDSYQPTHADLIGKAWIHIPSIGAYLAWARTPRTMAMLAVLLVLVLFAPPQALKNQARRRPRHTQGAKFMSHQGATRDIAFFLAGLAALASLLITLFAFIRPTSRTVPLDIHFQHTGQFSYTANGSESIYEKGLIQTGDPIFSQLVTTLPITFTYQLESEHGGDTRGTTQLAVELSDRNGWRRRFDLQEQQSFTGRTATASGVIDIGRIHQLIERFQQQTDTAQQEYKLNILAAVQIEGGVGGQALRDEFRPQLELRLADRLLQPVQNPAAADVFRPLKQGLLQGTRVEPSTFTLLNLRFDVAAARRWGLIGLALSLMSGAALALPTIRTMRTDASATIRFRYGSLLIAVQPEHIVPNGQLVDVISIDDLAKIAERVGGVIMHAPAATTQAYLVHAGPLTYRYRVPEIVPTETTAPTHAADWQVQFLATLRSGGRIAEACTAAGVWLAKVNQERQQNPEFARAWDDAQASGHQFKQSAGTAV